MPANLVLTNGQWNNCTAVQCPAGATSFPNCACSQPGYVAQTLSWDASGVWMPSTCGLINCPQFAAGAPNCACSRGYMGNLTLAGTSWNGTCNPTSCPTGATGQPNCTCTVNGYAGTPSWSPTTGWGPCTVVQCPTHATGGPSCTCNTGFGGNPVFNRTLNVWTGTCTDLNPCLTGNGGCSQFASCADKAAPNPGTADNNGRTCTCINGYVGDGITCTVLVPIGSARVTFTFMIPPSQARNATFQADLVTALVSDTGAPATVFSIVSVSSDSNGNAVVSVGVTSDPAANVKADQVAQQAAQAATRPGSAIQQLPVTGTPQVELPPNNKGSGGKAISDLGIVGIVLLVVLVSVVVFVGVWYAMDKKGMCGPSSTERPQEGPRADKDDIEMDPHQSDAGAIAATGEQDAQSSPGHADDVSVQ